MAVPKNAVTVPTDKPRGRRHLAAPMPYAIVSNPLPEDAYHAKLPTARDGHFKSALQRLASSKRGSVARFEHKRCFAQVKKAAKSLGYEVWYALDGDALLVQIVSTGKDN